MLRSYTKYLILSSVAQHLFSTIYYQYVFM